MSTKTSQHISFPSPSSTSIFMPFSRRSRRGSLASLTPNTRAHREAISQALDTIHTSASRSETLTTFNEFTSPPSNPASAASTDGKGRVGELAHGGLSGIYNPFRNVVGASDPSRGQDPHAPSSSKSSEATGGIPSSKSSEAAGGIRSEAAGRSGKPLPAAHEASEDTLQKIKSRILSKDFWMKDENCKECFDCGTAFSTWRRKHHCRICGQIFDAPCTSLVKGDRFGQSDSLRVCKRCVTIINEYQADSDGLEESDDDMPIATTFFQRRKQRNHEFSELEKDDEESRGVSPTAESRPMPTPMMAIPATRRAGDSSSRRAAVLEIDNEEVHSRPGSARSHRASIGPRTLASSHRRLRSRTQHSRPVRLLREDKAPFHRNLIEESSAGARLPAFHQDSIIDPDLAPYMSDEASSGDEQTGIFSIMHGDSGANAMSLEIERAALRGVATPARKGRSRAGERRTSVASTTSREHDVASVASMKTGHNHRGSRKNTSSDVFGSPSGTSAFPHVPSPPRGNVTRMTRSSSMKGAIAPAIELNAASLQHVRKLLRQLLQDSPVPNVSAWERALMPILLQCTDDVNPDIRSAGDDIDIRHYVKIKKIPGGRPADIAYVSGVVFSKNLALKCMARSITHPNIVIITFPIEFQRHQQHFMSLEPIIAQEKEYLQNMVSRIVALRPHVLLVRRNVSGLALQYLADANVATAYNVKATVLEAVSRCAQTEIITSIDMLVLKQVQVGRSAGFDTKTFVHREVAAGKKSYIYISGCPVDLGCTVVLRGASTDVLAKIKRITEFMIYVVYNLKLETSLMRDEFVLIPSLAELRNSSPAKEVKHGRSRQRHSIRRSHASESSQPLSGEPETGDPQTTSQSVSRSNDVIDTEELQGTAKEASFHGRDEALSDPHSETVPDDVPMPTLYSDMVEKHKTKILSASPFVKFMQPYLLVKAREQERRLAYLKRLRDQDRLEAAEVDGKTVPQDFYLITPEMIHETVKHASKKVIEVLHAVHDAEYDKALHNYHTQKRQWEAHIAGNINLFDPYAHQNIVVLYTFVCTTTAIPCAGPDLLALAFYNEHGIDGELEPDCTLGQFVEDLCLTVDEMCMAHGCERKMSEHHRSYVHGEARITVFAEKTACKIRGLQDSILMWSYCKICQKETQVMPMSENTWRYSFGKYLELSFWSSDLRLRASFCPHDLHRDHLRYFGYKNVAIRIHYDPIELLEIIVPRARITWKVELDLALKNELFTKIEARVDRFMNSVKARIAGITVDSVVPEKAEACRAEIDRLIGCANAEHAALIQVLRDLYMDSKYYEIVPLNRAIRALQEKVAEWDTAFADFDANFFPSEKDIRRLAALQLRRMFLDRDESGSSLEEGSGAAASENEDADPPTASGSIELQPKSMEVCQDEARDGRTSVVALDANSSRALDGAGGELEDGEKTPTPAPMDLATPAVIEGVEMATLTKSVSHVDLAVTASSTTPSPAVSHHHSSSSVTLMDSEASDPEPQAAGRTTAPSLSTVGSEERVPVQQVSHSRIPQPIDGLKRARLPAPPLTRAQTQPTQPSRTASRTRQPMTRAPMTADEFAKKVNDSLRASLPGTSKDGPLSGETAGLGSRILRKSGASLIPRSVASQKHNDTRVSALAKHFEQLSREFERERLRERRVRAAEFRQSRATPMTSSRPIVEVYRDVHEAVEEREASEDEGTGASLLKANNEMANTTGNTTRQNTGPNSSETSSSVGATAHEALERDQSQQGTGASASEAEGEGHDEHVTCEEPASHEPSEVASLTSHLDAQTDLRLDLPKYERSSLMKMLTNFWAERSASGWTPLEYPLNASDHVFLDSDVIVREDEPSSLIAFALSSEDYQAKLRLIHQQDGELSSEKTVDSVDHRLERSLLRSTGTHLKYQFQEGTARMLCKIFYAEQFDAIRRKCGVSDRIVESLSRCVKWDSKGGKSRSVFLKTLDERLVLKSLSPVETQTFLTFAPAYFQIMSEALFHELPTVIAKMLGFYQIVIKSPHTSLEYRYSIIVMENLFYDRTPTRIFDLKGSLRNRKIHPTNAPHEVLLDENMVEYIYESPLFTREHSKKLLRASVWNDTLFLARQNVMDYSLMIAVDEEKKELVVGIIDVIRTYTWDKKLESWIKDRGFGGGFGVAGAGRGRPTVTSPKEYKSRFREAMARYVLQAPNCWCQVGKMGGGGVGKRVLMVESGVATAPVQGRPSARGDTPSEKASGDVTEVDGESQAPRGVPHGSGGATTADGQVLEKEKEKRRWYVNV